MGVSQPLSAIMPFASVIGCSNARMEKCLGNPGRSRASSRCLPSLNTGLDQVADSPLFSLANYSRELADYIIYVVSGNIFPHGVNAHFLHDRLT